MSDCTGFQAKLKLKAQPCPFCRYQADVIFQFGRAKRVMCMNSECLAEGPYRPTDEEAVRLWNAAPRRRTVKFEHTASSRVDTLDRKVADLHSLIAGSPGQSSLPERVDRLERWRIAKRRRSIAVEVAYWALGATGAMVVSVLGAQALLRLVGW